MHWALIWGQPPMLSPEVNLVTQSFWVSMIMSAFNLHTMDPVVVGALRHDPSKRQLDGR